MSQEDNTQDIHARGMKNRRVVLGDEHVDRAVEGTNELNADFQEFITRYAWGEIWDRPGLDKKTRSLLTLSILVAEGKDEELQMHVRAAITNGVSVAEIKEVFMHAALYCGLPAANQAFKLATPVLKKLGKL
ncbi:MAG: 4-carboxymuconolactone decarboxylase [Opitutales bacterium]|jgi:3-oxoadipate enol-lactonase / 4-carboxymuconolactone decarboxylase|nr:4-carboxymuconolactone decarboxylase [Opitutales bacterium]